MTSVRAGAVATTGGRRRPYSAFWTFPAFRQRVQT